MTQGFAGILEYLKELDTDTCLRPGKSKPERYCPQEGYTNTIYISPEKRANILDERRLGIPTEARGEK